MCNKNCGKLCPNLITSTSITAGTSLVVNVPFVREKFCLVLTQNIPDTATINLPVVITIGDGTTEYQVVDCNGIPVTAGLLRTRTRYPIVLYSSNGNVTFQIKRKLTSVCTDIPFTVVTTTTGGGA
jgi:hypothetical protein